MADQQKQSAQPPEQPKAPRRYFIVNPRGAIHEVTREHAKERLRSAGWRMATPEEIAALTAANGHQMFDKPICPRWAPDPDAQLDEAE